MRRWRAARGAVVVAAVAAIGCSEAERSGTAPSATSTDTSTTATTATPGSSTPVDDPPDGEPPADETPTDATPPAATGTTAAPTTAATPPTRTSRSADCPEPAETEPLRGDGVELVDLGAVDDVRVSAALYPLPDHEGRPWSQWGQGVVLPDGRFVSAVGDHIGRDGNSWFYEYDPGTGVLTRTADVATAAGHRSGDWGYGKVHAQMVLGPCDEVVTTSYWGTLRDIELGGSYRGDHLLRYDPATHELTSLGVPVEGFGVPTVAISPDRRWVFGEAMDPLSDPWSGVFFAADSRTGEVVFVDEPTGVGFRSILVDAAGAAYHAAGDHRLRRYRPGDDTATLHDARLPGEWLRAATGVAPDGNVYGTTREPDNLFRFGPDGSIHDMGPAEGYVASLALSPDGTTMYYVPDAHGGSWENGTPLYAVDTTTGEHELVVELNPLIEPALDVRVGGSYNVVADPTGQRVFVGLNGSEVGSDEPERTFGSVVLAVVELPTASGTGDDRSVSGTADGPSTSAVAWSCTSFPAVDGSGIGFEDRTAARGLVEPLTGMYGHAVAAADVNDDGWIDLFVGGFADRPDEHYRVRGASGPSPDRMLLGGPDGFTVDAGFPGELARTSGAVFADLTGDGHVELVAARNPRGRGIGGRPTTIYTHDDDGWEPASTLLPDTAARAVAAVDIDRDGLLDLVVTADRWGGGATRLLRNDGDLGFTDATAAWGMPDDMTGLAVGTVDLDGDGWIDIVVSGDTRVLLGGPDGFRVERHDVLAWDVHGAEDDPAGIAVGDLDGDGLPDLVMGQHFNSTVDSDRRVPVRILLNRSGDAGLELVDVTAPSGSPGLWTKSPHVGVADLDNDGHPDIVTSAVAADGTPLVLRNTGPGRGGVPRFETVGEPGDGRYRVTGVEADVTGDGRIDLFQVDWSPEHASPLFENRGAAGRRIQVDLGTGGWFTGAGTRVAVTSGDGGLVATTWHTSSSGYAAGAPSRVHIGLGDDIGRAGPLTVTVTNGDHATSHEALVDGRSPVGGC